MSIVKVEAIVLRSMDYRETSKILTLFTREYGTIGVIVKGARRAVQKYGASLQPLSHISAVVYKKESRDLQLLSDVELVSEFPNIQKNFDKLFIALSVIELVYYVSRHEEKNEKLFELIIQILESIESATNSVLLLFYYFEAQLIKIFGFSPALENCSSCKMKLGESHSDNPFIYFEFDRGTIQCSRCIPDITEETGVHLSILKLWEHLSNSDVKEIIGMNLTVSEQGELDRIFSRYLEVHLPGYRKIRSKQIFNFLDSLEKSYKIG